MNEIGKLSNLEFIDLNFKEQAYIRAYTPYLKRCDESLRQIKYHDLLLRIFL